MPKHYLSPINIKTDHLINIDNFSPLNYEGIFQNTKLTVIRNTGKTVLLNIGGFSYLSGGPLKGRYTFKGMHFHWGFSDNEGSEHAINGQKYSLEAHFLFVRTGNEPPLVDNDAIDNEAKSESEESEDSETAATENGEDKADSNVVNEAPAKINEEVADEEDEKSEVEIEEEDEEGSTAVVTLIFQAKSYKYYNLLTYLPAIIEVDRSMMVDGNLLMEFEDAFKPYEYYSYTGSMTTPPFKEGVKFIVYKDILPVNRDQLSIFRSLKDPWGNTLDKNWLVLQKRCGRPVFYVSGGVQLVTLEQPQEVEEETDE